jgi:hypothetical protein
MLTQERLLPLPAPADKIAWQPGKGWYHNLKNWTTESVRADSQWWSKALCFGLVAMATLALAGGFGTGLLIGHLIK